MRSVSSCRYHSNRPAVLAALTAFLLVLLPPASSSARSDPALIRRTVARLTPDNPLVTNIVFAGNEAYDEEQLFSYMQTRESGFIRKSYYDRRTLLRDLANLERFYLSQGFLDADVEMDDISLSDDGSRVEVLIGVYEGDRWMLESVTFEGESVIPEEDLRALVRLEEGSPFIVGVLERDRRVLSEEYARRSYLDARVAQDVTRDDERRLVRIDYRIVERERATIASIDVEGDEKTRQFVVERELTFHEGEYFDFTKIGESQANIYRTGLFNSVWIEPSKADTGKPQKRVVVRVGERPSGELDFSVDYAGISLSEGLQGLDFLELGAEFRNRNVQGNATTMALGGRYGGLARDVRASVGDPWFLGKRVAAEFSAHHEWKDEESFVSEVTGGSFILSKKLGLNLTLEGGYEYDHSYVEGDVEDESKETSNLFLATVYKSRDDVLSASRGMFFRVESDLASSRLGGMTDFTRLDLDWRGYIRPRTGRVAALQLRAGWIEPRGDDDDEVPLTERYIVDRAGLVRGLARDALGPLDEEGAPTGGMALVLARGEVRFPVRKNLRGAAFVDAGAVFAHMDEVTPSGLAVGAGVGLRFETRIGVLRLDVGWPVSESGEAQYYFGVGQIF